MDLNAAKLPSVWGEADVPGKYLKTAAWLSREVTRGQGPRSVCYNNSNNNMSQNMCSSAKITGIVMTQGTHRGTKEKRSLPCGAPNPVEQQGEHISRDRCPGLYMLMCVRFRPVQ